jgi:hypothetical protein
MISFAIFFAGMSVEDALQHFRVRVDNPEANVSADCELGPELAELRPLLSDPITSEQAVALEDVFHGRYPMKDLVEWLESPAMDWKEFFSYRLQRDRDALWENWKRRNKGWENRERPKQMPNCPRCGSESVVSIVYGLPSEESMEASRRGAIDVVRGGCCISVSSPRWHCRHCKLSWPNGYDDDDDFAYPHSSTLVQ